MEVTKVKQYGWNQIVPNTIIYNEFNYYGTLYLEYIIYDEKNLIKIATYSGTVYCVENCPLTAQ